MSNPIHEQNRRVLHDSVDIYAGVIPRDSVRQFTDIAPLYEKLKSEGVAPLNACEVGSWCGLSAVRFAQVFDAPIVCVDTWLGSEEHWLDRKHPGHEMHMLNGRPRLYDEFLEGTYHFKDRITPLPLPSSIAAKVLKERAFQFDLIYLDGDHSFDGLCADIKDYMPLIAEGGILIGDDLNDPRFEVRAAVKKHFGADFEEFAGNWWITRF